MREGESWHGDVNAPHISPEMREAILEMDERETVSAQYNKEVRRMVRVIFKDAGSFTSQEEGDHASELRRHRDLILRAFRQDLFAGTVLDDLVELTHIFNYTRYTKEGEEEEGWKNPIIRFALDMISKLVPEVQEKISSRRLSDLVGLKAFGRLVDCGNKDDRKKGVVAMAERLDLIATGLDNWPEVYRHYVKDIMKYGDSVQADRAVAVLEEAVSRASEEKASLLISTFFGEHMPLGCFYVGWNLVRDRLERYGLPDKAFLVSWKVSVPAKKFSEMIYDNLQTIQLLEKEKKGVCAFLYKEFGIMDFGRYPVEMLQKQAEMFDDTSKPYGIILYPRSDWNGAFFQDREAFHKFFESLHGDFLMRIVECDGKMDVAKALVKLDRKYNPADGSGHGISLAIIGGHGEKDTIRFGGSDERHVLRTADLSGRGTKRIRHFFEENPTIILVSCSTGTKSGIGQELSAKLGAKVLAPKVPTNITAIHASKKRGDEQFRFNASFGTSDEKGVFLQGAAIEK